MFSIRRLSRPATCRALGACAVLLACHSMNFIAGATGITGYKRQTTLARHATATATRHLHDPSARDEFYGQPMNVAKYLVDLHDANAPGRWATPQKTPDARPFPCVKVRWCHFVPGSFQTWLGWSKLGLNSFAWRNNLLRIDIDLLHHGRRFLRVVRVSWTKPPWSPLYRWSHCPRHLLTSVVAWCSSWYSPTSWGNTWRWWHRVLVSNPWSSTRSSPGPSVDRERWKSGMLEQNADKCGCAQTWPATTFHVCWITHHETGSVPTRSWLAHPYRLELQCDWCLRAGCSWLPATAKTPMQTMWRSSMAAKFDRCQTLLEAWASCCNSAWPRAIPRDGRLRTRATPKFWVLDRLPPMVNNVGKTIINYPFVNEFGIGLYHFIPPVYGDLGDGLLSFYQQ